MIIKKEYNFNQFQPWSGAVDTWKRLEAADKLDELEWLLEDLYPDGIDETALNDLLWFEDDWVYNAVGMRTESEIRSDIQDKEEEIQDKEEEIRENENERLDFIQYGDYDEDEIEDIELEYYERELELTEELDELIEELEALKEELESI
jgi:hypothetical protein